MPSKILQEIANSIPELDENLRELEELIKYRKGIGETVADLEVMRTKLKSQRDKHFNQLKASGYIK